jgi:hypothetical protein
MLGENQRRDLLRTALNVESAEQPAVGVAGTSSGSTLRPPSPVG